VKHWKPIEHHFPLPSLIVGFIAVKLAKARAFRRFRAARRRPRYWIIRSDCLHTNGGH
jgi:hypothetical protein